MNSKNSAVYLAVRSNEAINIRFGISASAREKGREVVLIRSVLISLCAIKKLFNALGSRLWALSSFFKRANSCVLRNDINLTFNDLVYVSRMEIRNEGLW